MNRRTGSKPQIESAQGTAEPVIDTSNMSEGKRAALELAESSRESHWEYPTFAGALFMGEFPSELIHPYPERPEDRDARGQAFLDRLENFLRDHVDPDQIDRVGEIPQDVIDGLAAMGAFGIKIPTEYGGLGFSQQIYTRAAVLLGSYCGNVSALLSAHQSIGVPQPLLLFGTDAQKREFLPRVARGEISAFALTEDGVGSDPARMATTATPTEDGKHYIINGTKLWCTNGTRAGLIVVMAKTPSKTVNGRKRNQISAFIVDTKTPGVTVERRCHFMGLRSLYNGVIAFDSVRVPTENLLAGEGRGLRVALTTLNTGRVTLPAVCIGLSKASLRMAKTWANEREQWGASIGKHAAIADKIANMASTIFAMESMTYLTSVLVDRKKTDIRVEAAMAKMFCTEAAWEIVDQSMQILGGRGYETSDSLAARGETPYVIERAMRDCRINRIFEGSSEIMRLFIAREAMDPHLAAAGDAMNTRLPLRARIQGALKAAAFYSTWYPKQWLPSSSGNAAMDPKLKRHFRYVSKTSKRLSRKMFHAMAKHGPKLEREQMLLGRFVDVGTELFAQAATASRAQFLLDKGEDRQRLLALVDHFCARSRLRVAAALRAVRDNTDASGYRLAQQILADESIPQFEGIVDHELGHRRVDRVVATPLPEKDTQPLETVG